MHIFRGRKHHPETGRMLFETYYFNTWEEAKGFSDGSDHHDFKIYDDEGQLMHSGSNTPINTYA